MDMMSYCENMDVKIGNENINPVERELSNMIAERVIPEIQKIVTSISSSGNRDTEVSSSPNSHVNAEVNNGFRNKITKKDS